MGENRLVHSEWTPLKGMRGVFRETDREREREKDGGFLNMVCKCLHDCMHVCMCVEIVRGRKCSLIWE